MTNACIVGIGSDIGYEIGFRLISEGWRVHGTYHRRKPDALLFRPRLRLHNHAVL